MTDTSKTAETEAPATETTPASNGSATATSPDCGRWACGGRGEGGHCHWHGKRRWKRIGAVALIALFGFFIGRASGHHHDAHWQNGHYGQPQAMESYGGVTAPQSLGMILDGIGATTEQRAKAVSLFRQ
jgi:hypothetical protein